MSALKADLKAKDVMTPEPVCVEPTTTMRQLARVFEENEISGAPVVNREGRVVGVVSMSDVIRQWSAGNMRLALADLLERLGGRDDEVEDVIAAPVVCVEEFMTEHPVTVTPNTPAAFVARLMFEKRIHRIVVVDQDKFPAGIVTSLDLLGIFPQ